jgi:tetratricopeptide (TPR) repeat protein
LTRTSFALLLLALLAGRAPAQSSSEDPWHDCDASTAADRIQGCSAIIASASTNDEDRALAYFARGVAHFEQSDADATITDFTAALALHPTYKDMTKNLLLGRGKAYLTKSQGDKGLADFTAAMRLNPADPDAWSGIGQAEAVKGDYLAAINSFDKSLRLKTDISARSDRAYALLMLKRYREALVDYNLALKNNHAPVAQSLYGRGLARQALGDAAGAASDMAAAEKLTPGIAKVFERPTGDAAKRSP